MRRATILLAAAAVIGTVLGGCGQESATGTPAVPITSAPATGTAPSSPSTGQEEPDSRTIRVAVRDGQASGDTGRVEVPLGTLVTVAVTSDVADEIHVHGYDLEEQIPPGGTGSVSFTADIPGVFEVELHETGLQLLQLHVD